MSVEFTLEGLNKRQKMLADILWSFEEWPQVEAFIKTLPKREKAECESLIEMMKMAIVEQCYDGIQPLNEAKSVIDKVSKRV